MPASTESLICSYFRTALIVKLGLDPSQCSVGIVKVRDSNWQGKPYYLVVPGAARINGPGQGAQYGGSLIRSQEISVIYFGQLNTDQYSLSPEMALNETMGTLDAFERIRQIFAYTFLGNTDGTNCLLDEPVMLGTEGQSVLEDPDLGVFSREFRFVVQYAITLPGALTLSLPDVVNSVG